jgi:hypothetical protein
MLAQPANRSCPICHSAVAIGVQCSLCHRWYHITAPPGSSGDFLPTPPQTPGRGGENATGFFPHGFLDRRGSASNRPGVNSGGRRGCVPVPFLMPYFCSGCCHHAAELTTDLRNTSFDPGSDQFDAEDSKHFNDAELAELTASAVEDAANRQVLREALREIAQADEIPRSQRAVVQRRWKTLFTANLLRRLRGQLGRTDPLFASQRSQQQIAAGAAATMPRIEADVDDGFLSPGRKDGNGTGERDDEDDKKITAHLATLQRESDLALRNQRRTWVGDQLDYANVGTRGLRRRHTGVMLPPASQTTRDIRVSHLVVTRDDEDSGTDDDQKKRERTPF